MHFTQKREDTMMCIRETLQSYTEVGTGEPIEKEYLVEFHLLYAGELLGSGNKKPRPDEKHSLRRKFHPQLRRLWECSKNLNYFAQSRSLSLWQEKHPDIDLQTLAADKFRLRLAGIESISYQWERAGFNFVPLVTENLCLRCRIEILFLRPEEKQYIMKSADLDARLKTVFDALRIPANLSETGDMKPQEGENPFFCLLADDKLISEVSINTGQLLMLPGRQEINANDAFLVIRIQINHVNPTGIDQYFG